MSIHLVCTRCGKKLSALVERAGKRARCPACQESLLIPPPENVVPTSAPAQPAPIPTTRKAPPRARQPAGPLIPPPSGEADHDLIDMTAMVDIVFFLLIFFMVTSMHAMQSSISMPTPEAKPDSRGAVRASAAASDQVVVQVDADDTIAVDGEEVASRQELISRLREEEHDSLLVLASGDAMHGTVVMVLDAGSDAGMEQIRLVSEGFETD